MMEILSIMPKISKPYLGPSTVANNTLKGFIKIDDTLSKVNAHITFLSFNDNLNKRYNDNVAVISMKRFPFFDSIGELQTIARRLGPKFDIVHTHILQYVPAYLNTNLLFTIHGIGWKDKKHKKKLDKKMGLTFWEIRLHLYYPFIKKIIAISPYVIEELKNKNFDTSKTIIVGNPISSEFFEVTKREESIILYPATIIPLKNQLRFLKAVDLIKRDIKEYKIIFAGSGEFSYYSEVVNYARKKGINATFMGKVPYEKMLDLYSKATITALTSLQETFGMAILESLATGTPVIASKVGGIPYLVNDCGLLVDPLNIRDISDKLLLLIEDKSLRKKLEICGEKIAHNYKSDIIAKKLLNIYLSIE